MYSRKWKFISAIIVLPLMRTVNEIQSLQINKERVKIVILATSS